MGLTVRERADAIATFRWLAVWLMETLARWVPTTPELEVKVLFGRHLWELAQHADMLGRRTAELRLALHATREPAASFRDKFDGLAQFQKTADRVDGFYAGVLPLLRVLYGDYLARTDELLDEPSVRVLERILADLDRMARERGELRTARPDIAGNEGAHAERLGGAARSLDDLVDFRPPVAVGVDVA